MPPKKTTPGKGAAKPKATPSKASAPSKTPAGGKSKPKDGASAPPPSEPPPVMEIPLKGLANVLFTDVNNILKDSGRWPLVVDPSEMASTFLKYRDVNYVNTIDPAHMAPEMLRKALLGAIWFGKPLVLDMGDADMLATVTQNLDEVEKGLMESVFDKSILNEDRVLKLVKKEDGESYESVRMDETRWKDFKLIIMTKIEPQPSLAQRMYIIKIV